MSERLSLSPRALVASAVSLLVLSTCARAEAPATSSMAPEDSLRVRWERALERVDREPGEGVVWVGWAVRRSEEAMIMSDAGAELSGAGRGGSLHERLGLDRDRARSRVAFLFALPAGRGDGARVVATLIRSLWAPVDLGESPLLWLGEAGDGESVALLERIFARVVAPSARTDYGPMIAVHSDTQIAVPVLRRIVLGDLPEDVRAEAVSWIGYQLPDARVAELVAEVLDREPSYAILDEAVAALDPAEADRYGVLERMIERLGDHPVPRARALLAEALESYDDPRAVAALEAAARHDPASEVRREAVDALADSRASGAAEALGRIAVEAADPAVRREALDHLDD